MALSFAGQLSSGLQQSVENFFYFSMLFIWLKILKIPNLSNTQNTLYYQSLI